MASMGRLIAVVVALLGVGFPTYAQRGGAGHSGGAARGSSFASHSGGIAFHGSGTMSHGGTSFRGAVPSMGRVNFMSAPSASGNRYSVSAEHRPGRVYPGRPVYTDRRYGNRRPYVPAYGYGYAFPSGFTIWPGSLLDSGLGDSGYYANSGYDDQGYYANQAAPPSEYPAPAEYGPPQYPAPPVEQAEAEPADAYRPVYQRPQPSPEPESAVTLVFKDGRPTEQIHNYMLTRTTLFVQDEHRREIPVDELDLAATQKANKDAGVDFRLPGR